MIAYFPKPYEDELVYSVITRFYAHSGIPSSCKAKQYIYGQTTARLDPYGIGHMKEYVEEALLRHISREELVMEHTMFHYVEAFNYNKKRDFYWAVRGKNISTLYQNKKRHMWYCPLCAKEDAKNYGEAYYHITHQVMTACPIHKIKLKQVGIAIGKRQLIALIPLDDVRDEDFEPATEEEIAFSEYVSDFMKRPFSWNTLYSKSTLRNKADANRDMLARYFKGSYLEEGPCNYMTGIFRDLAYAKTDVILKLGFLFDIKLDELFL